MSIYGSLNETADSFFEWLLKQPSITTERPYDMERSDTKAGEREYASVDELVQDAVARSEECKSMYDADDAAADAEYYLAGTLCDLWQTLVGHGEVYLDEGELTELLVDNRSGDDEGDELRRSLLHDIACRLLLQLERLPETLAFDDLDYVWGSIAEPVAHALCHRAGIVESDKVEAAS